MTELDQALKDRQLEVAKQIVAVQRLYASCFQYQDEPHPSRAVYRAMREVERVFSDDDYDRAEHLTKVLACMIQRDAAKFAADPEKWIARHADD
jgi:hypothetical protein